VKPPLHARLLSLPAEGPALVAVSGGRDSVALLHLLLEAGRGELVLCHLDHGLRGESSAGDAAFVRALAASHGLPLEEAFADIRSEAGGLSIEDAARRARYRFFAGVAARRGIHDLFLGHHADDQVETVLWNLFRGAGRAGLGGMAPVSEREERLPDGSALLLRLHRPMLGIWREEIDAYIREKGLAYRDDESNATLNHTRNKIRLDLLPHIAALLGRDPRQALWRTADLLRHEEEWLRSIPIPDPALWQRATLSAPELRARPIAEQRRILHGWLAHNGVAAVGYAGVEAVRSLLEGGRAKINLAGGWHARRREKRLFLERDK